MVNGVICFLMMYVLCFGAQELHACLLPVIVTGTLLSAGCNLCRMSTEMVACIAVESISILEKLHSRGYGICNESVLESLLITRKSVRWRDFYHIFWNPFTVPVKLGLTLCSGVAGMYMEMSSRRISCWVNLALLRKRSSSL